jgi:hypothetical protein
MLLSECNDVGLLKQAVQELWDIIDDIDTASDMAKDNDEFYRNRVHFLQKKRWATRITTEGYELLVKTD